jgi:hypothetical protein
MMGRCLATIGGAGALALGLVAVMGAGPVAAAPTSGSPAVIHGNMIGDRSAHALTSNGFGLPTGNGFLSVFQTIPGQTLNVTVGSGTTFTLGEGDFNFADIAPGTYPITTTGMAGSPTGSVTVPTGGNVTSLIYLSANGTPTITGFANDLSTAPAGESRMVFRNTAQGAAVNITVNGASVGSTLANDGTSSRSVNLPGGHVDIVVKNSVSGTTVASLNAVLTPGLLVNEFVTGNQQAIPANVSMLSNSIPLESGYRLFASDGGVFTFPSALPFFGSMGGTPLNEPVVGAVTVPLALGYWMVASDGGIFSFGDASFFGSMGGQHLNKPIVGMATTEDGGGYWMVASDGGIFSFGDAHFYGSMGGTPLNKPIVGMASTPDGKGYWLVASDGGIFSFGDANFYGSEGGKPLNQPIVGMASSTDGGGYWMVASDGGIFNFGDATFDGSMGGQHLNKPIVGMMPSPDGLGYWLVASDGGIFSFPSSLPFFGSTGNISLNKPIVAGNASGSLLVG